MSFLIFFFQAEDGIRDAQESRGLGDVYKRQISTSSKIHPSPVVIANTPTSAGESCSSCNINSISQSGSGGGCAGQSTSLTHNNSIGGGLGDSSPVSYTHLTLPTKRIV
eukprot:TRINITY_DN16058_c0_g1_i1.p1 TRINITY_DN16058_c0_g1~~TRINITY_DN16058_c0_g1_i1.p1  ORF type:complete len:109 (-),score=31.18 TRINITY_DN16058_c0_g1_i1:162-488(-)